MATGSGLDAQIGVGEEVTWGTAVTPTRFYEFNSEDLKREPTFLEPQGLRPGVKYKRVNRVRVSRETVNGGFTVEHGTKGMGLLWKHALASSGTVATVSGGTAAKEQYHVPGDYRGKGLTVQVGRPEPSTGTVQPFTYAGCKIGSWEFSLSDGETPTMQCTVDGRSEATATALATASYISDVTVFDFSQASLTIGGSAATSSGKTTITGGTAVATIINEISFSGEAPMAVERFGIGSGGLKAEQLENDIPTITGSLSAEFSQTDYDRFVDNETIAIQLDLEGDVIEGSTVDTLSIIFPAVKLKSAAPAVSGPDIVEMSSDFEAYSDGTNPVIQVHIISTDTTV